MPHANDGTQRQIRQPPRGQRAGDAREANRAHLRMIAMIDDGMARILKGLDELGSPRTP